jgi:hypothetical protein
MSELNQPLLGGKPFVKKKRKHNRKLKTSHRKTRRKIKTRRNRYYKSGRHEGGMGKWFKERKPFFSDTSNKIRTTGNFFSLGTLIIEFFSTLFSGVSGALFVALIPFITLIISGITFFIKYKKLHLEAEIIQYQKLNIVLQKLKKIDERTSEPRFIFTQDSNMPTIQWNNPEINDILRTELRLDESFINSIQDLQPTERNFVLEKNLNDKRCKALTGLNTKLFNKLDIYKNDFYITLGNMIVTGLDTWLLSSLGIALGAVHIAPLVATIFMFVFVCINSAVKSFYYNIHKTNVIRILQGLYTLATESSISTKFCAAVFINPIKSPELGSGFNSTQSVHNTQTLTLTTKRDATGADVHTDVPDPVSIQLDNVSTIDDCVTTLTEQLGTGFTVAKDYNDEYIYIISNTPGCMCYLEHDTSNPDGFRTLAHLINMETEHQLPAAQIMMPVGAVAFSQSRAIVQGDIQMFSPTATPPDRPLSNLIDDFYDLYLKLKSNTPLTLSLYYDLNDRLSKAEAEAEAKKKIIHYLLIKLNEAMNVCENNGLDGDSLNDMGDIVMTGGTGVVPEPTTNPTTDPTPSDEQLIKKLTMDTIARIFPPLRTPDTMSKFEQFYDYCHLKQSRELIVNTIEKFNPKLFFMSLIDFNKDNSPETQRLRGVIIRKILKLVRQKLTRRTLTRGGGYSNNKKKKKHNKTKRKHNKTKRKNN